MKKALPIIVALLLAAFASVGIVRWARQQTDRGQLTSCVIAARDLRAGVVLTQGDLQSTTIRIPQIGAGRSVWEFVFGELTPGDKTGTLVGRKVLRNLRAGTPILESMLEPTALEAPALDWRNNIPRGRRALSIPVDSVGLVSGLVQVGDRVDMLVTLEVPKPEEETASSVVVPVPMGDALTNVSVPMGSVTPSEGMTCYLLQDVEILAVGSQTVKPAEVAGDLFRDLGALPASNAGSVTVALTPEQAQLVVFAINSSSSKFTLTMRAPGDRTIVDTELTSATTLDALFEAVGIQR